MAVVKATIKSEIKSFIEKLNSGDVTKKDPDQIVDDFADKLAGVIQDAIRSADVTCTIPAGTVSTGVSPAVVLLPAPLPISGSLN